MVSDPNGSFSTCKNITEYTSILILQIYILIFQENGKRQKKKTEKKMTTGKLDMLLDQTPQLLENANAAAHTKPIAKWQAKYLLSSASVWIFS